MLVNPQGKAITHKDPLEEATIRACGEEIQAILTKYNCALEFVQMSVNGMPVGPGTMRVVKIKTPN